MLAFHGDPAVKAGYLNRVMAHAAADEIIHGTYWERGKGCAVGCTIHSDAHGNYESELGIPIMLAKLEDRLFEGMQNGDAKKFPVRFLEAIQPGTDLSRVGWLFLHWLLTEELASRDDPRVAKEIKACADVLIPLTKGEPCDRNAADLARRAAREARSKIVWPDAAAYAVAYDAADAAYASSYAAGYAAAAADAAAYDAADAAYAVAYDAADYATTAAAAAARSHSFAPMAEKLLELMAAAPLVPFGAGIAA